MDQDSSGQNRPNRAGHLASLPLTVGWLPYLTTCAAGLTLVLFWLGPNAGDGLKPLASLLFWGTHVVSSLAILAGTQLALSKAPRFAKLSGVSQVILGAIVASVLFTPIALAIDAVFQAEGSVDDIGEPIVNLVLSEYGNYVVPFILIWLSINAPSLLSLENPVAKLGSSPPEGSEQQVKSQEAIELWSRVPRRLGRDIVALSAELHYLRVFTAKGETLVLFPFGRAVKALEAENGMQVHRSHWIALPHVDEVTSKDGKIICNMINGPSVPVSRSYRADLKNAIRSYSV